jgi:hypothetical protein
METEGSLPFSGTCTAPVLSQMNPVLNLLLYLSRLISWLKFVFWHYLLFSGISKSSANQCRSADQRLVTLYLILSLRHWYLQTTHIFMTLLREPYFRVTDKCRHCLDTYQRWVVSLWVLSVKWSHIGSIFSVPQSLLRACHLGNYWTDFC